MNTSMMAADVLQSGGQVCAFCQSHDHWKEECALTPPSSGSDQRPWPYRLTEEVCRRFNRPAGCTTSKCKFDHKCWSCGAPDHGASSCRSMKPESSKPHPPPGPPPPQGLAFSEDSGCYCKFPVEFVTIDVIYSIILVKNEG